MAVYKRKELHLFRTWAGRQDSLKVSKKCYNEYVAFSEEKLSYETFANRVRDYKRRLRDIAIPKKVYVERVCPKCGRTYKSLVGRDGLPVHNRCLKCKNLENGINSYFAKTTI